MNSSNIKQIAVSGAKWTGSATAITLAMQMGSVAVLSRLIHPEDFGIMGMITVVIGFAQTFADVGISNAVIYKKDNTRDELSSLYWLNLAMGIFLFALLFAMEPLVSAYFREPRLRMPYLASTFIFLLLAPGQQFQALLMKNMKFKTLSRIQIGSSLLGYGGSIVLALMGYGIFALVFGQIILQASNTIALLWVASSRWMPQIHFKLGDLKEYLKFGIYQMGEKLLNYFSSNVDYMIIGRIMGAEPLGYYSLAYRVVTLPLYRINPVISRVAFPMFSRMQDDNETLKKGYLRIVQFLSLVVSPFLVGAIVLGKPFVMAVFGERWIPSLFLIQVMAFAGILKTISNPSGSVILAKGRADIAFLWNLLWTIIRVAVIWWTCLYGLSAVAWGILCMTIFSSFFIQFIINELIEMKMIEFLKSLAPAGIAVSTMALGLLIIGYFLNSFWENFAGFLISRETIKILQLVVPSIFGAVIYLGILRIGFRHVMNYYWNLLKNK